MHLRVVSLNCWDGGTLWEQLIEFLKSQNADIVFLQEIYHTQNPEITNRCHRSYTTLSDELDFPYAHFASAFNEPSAGHQVEQGNAVFSLLPLEPKLTTFFDIPYGVRPPGTENFTQTPRNLQHVVAELPAINSSQPPAHLHLFNTQGIWGLDGGDNDRRLQMADTIIEQLASVPEDDQIILAGDFNVRPDTKTVAKLEKRVTNVFKDQLKSSFNMRRKSDPGYAAAVVDMVFVSPDIQVTKAVCPNVDISDHLPLVVEVEV